MGRTNASNFMRMTMTSETDGSGLVFEVQDTAGTPDAPFYAVVNLRQDALREVIKVSSKTGTSLSVASLGDRYLEGSAAGSGITHPNGSQILLAPVAQNLGDLWDFLDGLELDDLADVDTSGAGAGDVLAFDGSEWVPDDEVVRSEDVSTILALTQAQYDAIPTPDPETLYVITD